MYNKCERERFWSVQCGHGSRSPLSLKAVSEKVISKHGKNSGLPEAKIQL